MHEKIVPFLNQADKFRYAVICGLPKSGTTLPLTLLDGHPQLHVFPEELRYMDTGFHFMDSDEGLDKFLNNGNIQQLKLKKTELTSIHQHHGTGYGKRDYSNVDFDVFVEAVRLVFHQAQSSLQRYFGLFLAFEISKGGDYDSLQQRKILVSKAPHNELYLMSWMTTLGELGSYIWTIRDPVEHYYSDSNTAKKLGIQPHDVVDFSGLINSRYNLFNTHKGYTILLKYEELIADAEREMRDVAEFLAIEYDPCMKHPTKNNVSWMGNSSRGIKKEAIYKNPPIAREVLAADDVNKIESITHEFMLRFGYA